MFKVALAGVLSRKLRLLLTSVAIVLGVGFVSSAFFLTDSISGAFEQIFEESTERIDVEVQTRSYRDYQAAANRGQGAFTANDLTTTGMRQEDVEAIRDVDGVRVAFGAIFESGVEILDEDGERVNTSQGAPSFSVGYEPAAVEITRVEFLEGREPREDGEVVIDERTAEKAKLEVGDDVSVFASSAEEVQPYTVVGIATMPGIEAFGGAVIAIYAQATLQELLDAPGRFSLVDVQAEPGVSPTELRDRIDAELGDEFLVQTAAEYGAQSTKDMDEGFIGFFKNFILVFAFIAVFVGAFVILNTFSILVGQRTREFGMLRTIGASRRGVLGIVIIEALVLGVVASVIGIAAGFGIANGLRAIFNALDFGLPSSSMTLTGEILGWSFGVGVLVTLVASVIPAWRAARLAPLEALRLGSHSGGGSWKAPALGVVFLVVGVALVLLGLNPDDDASTKSILFQVGGGAALVFIGVSLLARLFIAPVTLVLAPLLAFGTTGRIAARNVLRNRARSASTAIALMIGLALATLVLVLYSSTIRTIDYQIDSQVGSDVTISNPIFSSGPPTVPADLAADAAQVDGVETAHSVYVGAATAGDEWNQTGSEYVVAASEGTFERDGALELVVERGDLDLGEREILVSDTWAADNGAKVGDEIELSFADAPTRTVTVQGVYRDTPLLQNVGIIVSKPLFDATQPTAAKSPSRVLLATEDGVTPATVVERIEKAYGTPGRFLDVLDNSGLRAQAREQLAPFIGFILAMLALSLMIALFGISNTLALNVFERTREIGLLRAIGTTRRQLRRMIRIESVLVALFGAAVGTGLGVLGGVALVEALSDQGFLFSISPWLTILVLAGGFVAGLLASILPARRASRMDVLEAIATE